MSRGRLEGRYGYGAGRVPLPVVPSSRRIEPRPLLEGLRDWQREGAPARTAKDFARGMAPPLVAALAMWMLLVNVDRDDDAGVRIVPFPSEPIEVAQAEPPPEAIPEPPPPEPEPVVPEPEPEPVVVPEPPPVVAKVEPPKPKPRVERPKPPPPPKQPRRPPPQIDQVVAQAPTPPPPPKPVRRRPQPVAPKVAPAPALAIDELAPETPDTDPTPRRQAPSFAVARAPRPAPNLTPVPALEAPAAPAPEAPSRSARPRRDTPKRSSGPPLPQAVAALPSSPERPHRAPTRAPRAAAPPPAGRRSREKVELASVGAVPEQAPKRPAPAPRARRPAVAPTAPAARARSNDPKARIPGVSLGSLAPCVSDARELALKQKVVAEAGKRASCESPAGRFHLVETKNVNAFLMGIEPAPGRRSGDRCEELAHALSCLAKSPQRSRR